MDKSFKTTCSVCGDKVEAAHVHRGDESPAICGGCRLDTSIPCWFVTAEAYQFSHMDKLSRAGCRPQTGVPLLDDGKPPRLCDIVGVMSRPQLVRMAELEARAGLDAAEYDQENK